MKLDVSTVLEGVDVDAVRRLVKGTYMEKYAQPNGHIRKAIRLARQLGLEGPPRRRILDVGSGVGWFVRVCWLFGHHSLGIDQPGYMHAVLAEQLSIPYVDHAVTAKCPVQSMPPDVFDLVTMVSFNTHGDVDLIAALNKAILRIVRPPGRLYISPNEKEGHTIAPKFWSGWDVVEKGRRHILLEKPGS